MKILANDGISKSGIDLLTQQGCTVITNNVAQQELINYINNEHIDVILVRSATKVRKDIIDACPSLKIIGRGGVGMDNIDVEYARSKGLKVINTPASSSASVAELVFAHLFGGVRFLHLSNREMPLNGETQFKALKKAYAKGIELRGKTIGIIGIGRIGTEVAKIALGLGMRVLYSDHSTTTRTVNLDFFDGQQLSFKLKASPFEKVLAEADFITLHIPAQDSYVIDEKEINQMKDGAVLINAARGGVVNEKALLSALEQGKLRFAALDTFEDEPQPSIKLLMNENLSLSPHTGAATVEAQDRIGEELAEQILAYKAELV